MSVFTQREFEDLTAYQKGYAVYLFGCRQDQPAVPESYEPAPTDLAQYEKGQYDAILAVQDSP